MARTAADAQRTAGARGAGADPGDGANGSPDGPTDLPKESWVAVLKRTFKEFKDDNITDWAAALTYYAVLSIFPMLIVIVSILGLIGTSATQPLIDNLGQLAPGEATKIFTSAIKNLQSNQGAAGVMAIVSIVLALWSASGYVAAFMRASNAIYEVEEGRPIWKTAPVRLGVTFVQVVLLIVSAVMVVFTGPLAQKAGDVIGLGSTAVDVWSIAKWPVLLLIISFMFALLYWASPNAKQPGFRWVSPGGILGVVIWIVASAAFAFYVANFGSYNKTYGALAGVIIFLVWLWISNVAVLLGAEFNAELERGRRIQQGHPAEKEPFVEPRDTKKMSDEGKAEVREAQGPDAVRD
ncbi:MAG: rane protein [Thermoleophilaceae bacterium]|nr:rane protein [Thermoleophilaceae bacterium]